MTDDSRSGDVVSLGNSAKGLHGKDVGAMRRYWQDMRKDGDVPRRSDIDPRGIENLLENALIAEKIAPGLARLRIAGQHLGNLMGMEVRGMPLSAFIAPDHRDQLSEALIELFERPAIATFHLTAPASAGCPEMHATLTLMPLRSDLGDVSRALGCLVTRGEIGRTPRRFEITKVHVEPVGANAPLAAQARPRPGFAEEQTPFPADAPTLSSERPYLRLVRDVD